ncbi:MAG: OmpA family protein [Burkholderiales bacterium]
MMLSPYRGFVLASLFVALLTSGCSWFNRSREPASERGVINSAGADVTFANDQKKARNEAAAKAASSASDGAQGSGGAADPAAGGATATPLPADSDSTSAGGGQNGAGDAMADRDAISTGQRADTSGAAANGRMGPEGGDAMMEKVTLQGDALFQFGKADEKGMLPGGKQRLDELADKIMAMDAGTIASIKIVGHADRLGSPTGNMKISEKRAATVMNYLVRHGVDAAMMESMGKGDADPVTDCPGARANKALIACLSPNRRVEVMINAK